MLREFKREYSNKMKEDKKGTKRRKKKQRKMYQIHGRINVVNLSLPLQHFTQFGIKQKKPEFAQYTCSIWVFVCVHQ